MAGTKRAIGGKEYRLKEKQFETRWNKASNTVDDLMDSNPDSARQFTEAAKSAARIIDAAITNMYIYDEDPALPTSDDIQFTLKALARDAAGMFFAHVGFHGVSDFETASLMSTFASLARQTIRDMDSAEAAEEITGPNAIRVMIEIGTVKGIPIREQKKMFRDALALDR